MRATETLQYILQRWHRPSMHPQVNKVVQQLKTCRTARQGYHLYRCGNEACGRLHYRYHSCRNRHCPQCGGFQKQEWIEQRTAELLPTHYFHVVFTLPHQLNSLILGNRKELFKLLFDASAATLLQFARDEKHLGAVPGILSVPCIPGGSNSAFILMCIVLSAAVVLAILHPSPNGRRAKETAAAFCFPYELWAKCTGLSFYWHSKNS